MRAATSRSAAESRASCASNVSPTVNEDARAAWLGTGRAEGGERVSTHAVKKRPEAARLQAIGAGPSATAARRDDAAP